jgi:multiple sugar transport system permease protein
MTQKKKRGSVGNAGLGIALMIPGLILLIVFQLIPLFNTFSMSFQDVNLLQGGGEVVGLENYIRLAEDQSYRSAIGFTSLMVSQRVLIVALIPLVGLLVGQATRGLRLVTRILVSVAAVATVPTVIAALYWSVEQWFRLEREASPLLASPDSAGSIILLLDGLLATGAALAVGVPVFMAVLRGRRFGRSAWWVVWIIGILLALASFPKTFALVNQLTGGGPANATMTLPVQAFRESFQMMRFGYGAAQSSVMAVSLLTLALVVGLFVTLSNTRIRFLSEPVEHSGGAGVVGLVLMILMLLPLLTLVVMGYTVQLPDAGSGASEMAFLPSLLNSIIVPWAIIWLVALPTIYLLALALGYHRPFGRVGANIIFVLCLMLAILPPEVLGMAWFTQLQDFGLLDTRLSSSVPVHLTSFIGLLVMKLYFDGAYEHVAQMPGATFGNSVLGQSLLIAVVVGVVLSLLSLSEVYWALIALRSQELTPISVTISQMAAMFAMDMNSIRAFAGLFQVVVTIMFLPIIALLQIFVVDRLGILTNASVDVEYSIEDTIVERDDTAFVIR